jgi:hypothetical protein
LCCHKNISTGGNILSKNSQYQVFSLKELIAAAGRRYLIMARLAPNATLHIVDGVRLFLLTEVQNGL